ncbi:MAG TPA: hypothetical protein DCW90_14045 [Lachnospiraceae bacterium]|nr:hypothetical protein [uncultured Lachnoclostridium sp.]HAU86562.1 hypothetical protein [Lachnospiraceae bacterium]
MNDNPKLITDMEYLEERDNVIIFGSRELNRYVKLRCRSLNSVQQLLALFDGEHSVNQIEDYCKQNSININMSTFINELRKNGFFLNEETEKRMNNEIDIVSIKLFEKKFSNYIVSDRSVIISKWIITLCNICLLSIFFYSAFHWEAVTKIFNLNILTYKSSYLSAFLITFVLSAVSLFLHEFGHVLFGIYNRLGIEKIGVYLYLGFMPKWVIKFRSLQIAPKRDKLTVLFGGMYCNLMITAVSIFLCSISPSNEICKCLIVSNISIIINCLSPFKLTDGYFIFSIWLGINNWRLTMLKNIKKLSTLKLSRDSIVMNLYMCINVVFYILKIFLLYYWIAKSLLEVTKFSYIFIVIMGAIHIFIIGYNIRKSFI